MYSGGNEKTAAKSFVEITRLCTIRRHTKKAAKLNLTKMWPVSSFGFAGMERRVAPSAVEGVRSQATGASCPMGGRSVTSSTELVMPRNSDSAVLAGTECAKQWLLTWQNSEEPQPEQIR